VIAAAALSSSAYVLYVFLWQVSMIEFISSLCPLAGIGILDVIVQLSNL